MADVVEVADGVLVAGVGGMLGEDDGMVAAEGGASVGDGAVAVRVSEGDAGTVELLGGLADGEERVVERGATAALCCTDLRIDSI